MRKTLLVVALALPWAIPARAAAPFDPKALIGKPLPAVRGAPYQGWEFFAARPIGPAPYRHGFDSWKRDGRALVLLSKIEGNGKERTRVVSAIAESPMPNGHYVAWDCTTGSEIDDLVVAVVRDAGTEVQWFTDVKAAWRANLSRMTLERISTKGIRCDNAAFTGVRR